MHSLMCFMCVYLLNNNKPRAKRFIFYGKLKHVGANK